MSLDSDVALFGTGVAPLVAASHLLSQGPVISIGVQPNPAISPGNQEERFSVVNWIYGFSDVRRDEHPVLVIYRYVVISIQEMHKVRAQLWDIYPLTWSRPSIKWV